ncbi:MAG: AlpA family phage regulatory protein [Bosea sp.]|uniref:helix-turn-helix transcriptional regulator n=1 Tax=Bosea sp. (in: a-proteobacteria) TaxID=1871050 RepID=UPI001ACA3711|nr:AlpA family phage regulatory protein [Bosea sp. (in: a-proteobacteria)]
MPTTDTLLTIEEVAVRTRLSKPTIYKLIRQGAFPQQLRLCANKVAWLEREVAGWIATRAEARAAG